MRVPTRRRLRRWPGRLRSPARLGAPETSPCHVAAKQNGELDPQAVSVAFAAVLTPAGEPGSAASRAARVVGDGADNASAQLGIHSARGQPRVDSCVCQKPRATAWRPIQSDEVEHPAHVSRCGIDVPDSGSFAALARDASVRPTSSPRRAEVGSTAVEHRALPFARVHCAGMDAAFRWAGRMPAGPPRPLQSFGRQWQKNRFGSKGSRLRHR